jgi:hypothetical protein
MDRQGLKLSAESFHYDLLGKVGQRPDAVKSRIEGRKSRDGWSSAPWMQGLSQEISEESPDFGSSIGWERKSAPEHAEKVPNLPLTIQIAER